MADFELAMHTYACCLYKSPPKSGSTNDYGVCTLYTHLGYFMDLHLSGLLRLLLSIDSLDIQNGTEKGHDDSQPLFIA